MIDKPQEIIYPGNVGIKQYQATDITGFPYFQTVTAVPTIAPQDFQSQIVIVFSGGIYQLYIYETTTAAWKAVVIT